MPFVPVCSQLYDDPQFYPKALISRSTNILHISFRHRVQRIATFEMVISSIPLICPIHPIFSLFPLTRWATFQFPCEALHSFCDLMSYFAQYIVLSLCTTSYFSEHAKCWKRDKKVVEILMLQTRCEPLARPLCEASASGGDRRFHQVPVSGVHEHGTPGVCLPSTNDHWS